MMGETAPGSGVELACLGYRLPHVTATAVFRQRLSLSTRILLRSSTNVTSSGAMSSSGEFMS